MRTASHFSSLVQCFFTQHLCGHKQVSPRTITAYRDAFRLLFAFMQDRTGRPPSDLELPTWTRRLFWRFWSTWNRSEQTRLALETPASPQSDRSFGSRLLVTWTTWRS